MKPSARKLTVGISGSSARTKSVRAMMRQIDDEGGKPEFLAAHLGRPRSGVDDDIARIDALVIMGNDLDIDPAGYIDRYPEGHSRRCVHPETKSEAATPKGKARARYEDVMIRKALDIGMPLLGICGGMQRLNIICGGTLHQHLPDLVGCDKHRQHRQGIAPHIPVVPIVIKEETRLAAIARNIKMPFALAQTSKGPKVVMENSMHHQAVDRVGEGLCVSAVTDTVRLKSGCAGYLPEALETDPEGKFAGQFILGVQWHPEFGASSLGQHIVRHMLAAAQEFARLKPQRAIKLIFARVRSVHLHG